MADIKLSIIVRATSVRGTALYQGATREYVNETTGEITEKEHWHWVPSKLVQRVAPQRGRPEIVKLPEWLAKREGLI